jgi:hypothetical protein
MTADESNCTKDNVCNSEDCFGVCRSDPSLSYQCQCPQNICDGLSQSSFKLSTTAIAAITLCAINVPRKQYLKRYLISIM